MCQSLVVCSSALAPETAHGMRQSSGFSLRWHNSEEGLGTHIVATQCMLAQRGQLVGLGTLGAECVGSGAFLACCTFALDGRQRPMDSRSCPKSAWPTVGLCAWAWPPPRRFAEVEKLEAGGGEAGGGGDSTGGGGEHAGREEGEAGGGGAGRTEGSIAVECSYRVHGSGMVECAWRLDASDALPAALPRTLTR